MSLRLIVGAIALVALSSPVTQVSAQQPKNLVLYYNFDSGSFPVPDNSGNGGPSAAANGAVTATAADGGKFGRGVDFGEYDNLAWLDASSETAFTSILDSNSITVAFHQFGRDLGTEDSPLNNNVNFRAVNTANAAHRIVGTHAPWSNGQVYWDIEGTGSRVNGAMPEGTAGGKWTHLAFTKNGEDSAVYVDGELVLSRTGVAAFSTLINQFAIGAEPAGAASFNGLMDEFAVWDKALTADEVAQLAENPVDFTFFPVGDVNKDQVTDLVDYGIIRDNLGNVDVGFGNGDLDGNGVVDLHDFGVWKDDPDNSVTAGASQAAVPEPTAGALAALGALLVALRSRRRR